MLDLEKLLKIPGIDSEYGFDISPDGKTVAFSWNASGQWEIYTLPLDLSSPPHCISEGLGGKFAPYFSPDGTQLAYCLDLDGGENFDIWLYDILTAKHLNLTPDTEYAIQPEISWSPDGSQLAFISDASGKFEAYRLSLSDNSVHRLAELPFPVRNVKWSPAADKVAMVTYASGQDYFTYLVSVESGNIYPISNENGPICAKDVTWSPDGSRLAFASNLNESYQIGIIDCTTKAIAWLTADDKENEHPCWSPNGDWITYVAQAGPSTEMAILSVEGRSLSYYSIAQGIHYRPMFTPDNCAIVLVFDSPCHPPDLWCFSLREKTFEQLTNSLPEEFQKNNFTIPEHIWYSGKDGEKIPAMLYRPYDEHRELAAVVYIHGGPNWLSQFTWDPLIQHMVSRGWVVLAPNYRGSTGYGKAWQLANLFDLGRIDTSDVAAGVDYLIDNHIAKPDLIAVTGRSHGGYLTMTCLTQYPELWAGGSAVVPFLNWFTSHENSRPDLQHWDLENFGDPVINKERYYERSPYFFLDRIKAPVQLICGANDPRCPASESIQAYEVMQKLGKPCDFVLYPDEGHAFLKIKNVVDAKKRQVEFLASLLEK